MDSYAYKPVRFYLIVFGLTWAFWISAILCGENDENIAAILMLLGLFMPAVTAILTVLKSGNNILKKDFRDKLIGFYRIQPSVIIKGILIFVGIVVISILISLLFEQPLSQVSFTEDFSFSIYGVSGLITILFASVIEEVGWRGYGEDSVANYCTWFKESIIFGCIWAIWHLPLFWIPGTYQYGLMDLGIGFVLNFIFAVIPLGFLTTWIYVENNRSMLACIIFHLFVNFMQEKIAMTPITKCIETFVIVIVSVIIVMYNKKLFFGKEHIGNMLIKLSD